MAAAQAAAQGRNFPVMIRSYLFVRRACGSVSAGERKGVVLAHRPSRSPAPASPAGADACRCVRAPTAYSFGASPCGRGRTVCTAPCALCAVRGMQASSLSGIASVKLSGGARATQCADPVRTVRVPRRSTSHVYPALRPPRALPAAIALVACLPALFATAVATPLAATLLAARAPRPWNRAQPPRCRSRAARATATRDPRRAQRRSVRQEVEGGGKTRLPPVTCT